MAENNQQQNNEQNSQLPETLEVYKASRGYKIRQMIKHWSPKKKLVFLILPFLAVAVGLILYFTLAAPGDPEINLVWPDTNATIDGSEVRCGDQDLSFNIRLENNQRDIVTVGAFIAFDPDKVTVTSIDVSKTSFPVGEEITTPTNQGTLQKIDNVNGLIQVIRAYPVDSGGHGFTAANGVLATIHFDVKQNAERSTIFRLNRTDPGKTVMILNGGRAIDPNNTDNDFQLAVKCCLGDICGANETCPSNNWQDEPERCCNVDCVEATRLYLEPSKATVNVGQIVDKDGVDLMLASERADIATIKVILTFDANYLAISATDIVGNNMVGTMTAAVAVAGASSKITLEFSQYKGVKAQSNRLATLKFKVKNEIDLPPGPNQSPRDPHQPYVTEVKFEKNYGTGSTGSTNLFNLAGAGLFDANNPIVFTDGEYTIILPPIVLRAGTQLTVEPSYNSARIHWYTEPASSCGIEVGHSLTANDINKWEHDFEFTGLNQGDKYEYDITCDTENHYKLVLQKNFKTPMATNLSISQARATGVAASKAKISWLTTGGKNSDGRSDSTAYYREKGKTDWPYSKHNAALVPNHGLDLIGLSPSTTYEYYVHSSVDGTNCAIDTATPDCAASKKVFSFVTKNKNEAADANLILKVNRDRVCDEWLYCDAAVQVLNTKKNPPRNEDVCFATGVCNALDKGGQCLNIVDKGQGVLTFNTPKSAGEIKNLSGYSKIGLDWGYRCAIDGARKCSCSGSPLSCADTTNCSGSDNECVAAKIDGYYPYSVMAEVGLPIGIPNPSFEEGSIRPWQSYNLADITNVVDPNDKTNRVLKIEPKGAYSGATADKMSNKIITTPGALYVVSFRAKTDNFYGQKILVELGPYKTTDSGKEIFSRFSYYDNESRKVTTTVALKSYWQEYVVSLTAEELVKLAGMAGGSISADSPLNVAIIREPLENSNSAFYVDNVSMKSVLSVSDDLAYVPRSCRLYPSENAPACDYYDADRAKDMKGWKGYCVETDPGYRERKYLNQPMCLLWWPVDIISGEANTFSADSVAGYTDRKPLYYCLEARGNYAREDIRYCTIDYSTGACSGPDQSAKGDQYQVSLKEFLTLMKNTTGENIMGQQNEKMAMFSDNYLTKEDIIGVAIKGGSWSLSASLLQGRTSGKDLDYYESYKWLDNNRWEYKYSETKYDWVAFGSGAVPNYGCSPETMGNFVAMMLDFDNDHNLIYLNLKNCDDAFDTPEALVEVIFYLREPCLKIAQTVTIDGETVPWAQRVNSQKITTAGWLGYVKDQDYAPFGGAVVPRPLYSPPDWENNNEPLFVEPADTLNMTSPYQVRAGSPYGVSTAVCLSSKYTGTCNSGKVCEFPEGEGICFSDDDCGQFGSGAMCQGEMDSDDYGTGTAGNCVAFDNCCSNGAACGGDATHYNELGPASCVSGPNVGNNCQSRQDCGMEMDSGEYGMCVGFKAPEGVSWEDLNTSLSSTGFNNATGEPVSPGVSNLSKLFAKSYGIWKWEKDTAGDQKYKYIKISEAWDITGKGVLPQVPQILVNNSDKNNFVLTTQGSAVLKFSSWVDPNQVPLVRYTVDWDDGKESVEAGLRIPGRDISNPHILVHYYKYREPLVPAVANDPCDATKCTFKPKIQLEDNWGRCNNDKDTNGNGQIDTAEACQNDSTTYPWAQFKKEIVVYKDQGGVPGGVMSVEPTTLTYIVDSTKNFYLPFPQSFAVSNATIAGGNLSWSFSVEPGGFLDPVNLVDYKIGPANGYTGVLGPDQSQEVKLTINNIGSLAAGEHKAYIKVKDITDTANIKTEIVTVNLVIGPTAPPGPPAPTECPAGQQLLTEADNPAGLPVAWINRNNAICVAASENGCSQDGTVYDSLSVWDRMNTGANDDIVWCENNLWSDCDSQDGNLAVRCGLPRAQGGYEGFGEYDAIGEWGACGDDINEYYVCNTSGTCGCCYDDRASIGPGGECI